MHAVFVHQRDVYGLRPGGAISVRENAVRRQGRGIVNFLRRAVTPIDAIFGHRIPNRTAEVGRIHRIPQVQRINVALHHRQITAERNRGSSVGHDHLEAVNLDAVRLTLLIIGRYRDSIRRVFVIRVTDVVRRRITNGENLRRRTIAPVDGQLMTFRIGIVQGNGAGEESPFTGVPVVTRFKPRPVVDVLDRDVGEHRRRRERDAVRTRPAELVEPEVIEVALIGEQSGLQIGRLDFLVDRNRNVVQPQHAFAGQGGDPDRHQRLAVRIVEARGEERIAQRRQLFFVGGERHVTDRRRRIAETLQTDFLRIVAAVRQSVAIGIPGRDMAGVGNHEAAVGHAGDGGIVLRRVTIGIDHRLVVDRLAGGVVLLHHHAPAAAVGAVGIRPGHHPAAVFQRRDTRVVLGAVDGGIDAELGAHFDARGIVALRVNPGAAQILAFRLPDDDEAAALERGHRRVLLGAVGVGVDLETPAQRRPAGVEALAENTGAVTVSRIVTPDHDETRAIGIPGDTRLILRGEAKSGGIRPRLRPDRHATRVIALEKDIIEFRIPRAASVVIPRHHKPTIGRRGDIRHVLIGRGRGIDPELGSDG